MTNELQRYEEDFLLGMIVRELENSLQSLRDAEGTPVEDDMEFQVKSSFKYHHEIGDKLLRKVKDDEEFVSGYADDYIEKRDELREELYD